MSKCSGYMAVFYPEHPKSWSTGYVHVHKVVAEWKIGRTLAEGEQVHHINGTKLDNSPENIAVMSCASDHCKVHGAESSRRAEVVLECAYCGKNILRSRSRSPSRKGYRKAYCNHVCAGKATGFQKIPDEQKSSLIRHGTLCAYNYHRCRCDECRVAKRDEARLRRARKALSSNG